MPDLHEVTALIRAHLSEIEPLFESGVKFTFIARSPYEEDADVIVTNDNFRDVLKAINRLQARDQY